MFARLSVNTEKIKNIGNCAVITIVKSNFTNNIITVMNAIICTVIILTSIVRASSDVCRRVRPIYVDEEWYKSISSI